MDKIVYPTMAMHEAAQQIRNNASSSLSNHEMFWQRVQNCISPLPGFIQSALNTVLEPHNQRLRASFQWQIDFADQLEQATQIMEELDQHTAQSFSE